MPLPSLPRDSTNSSLLPSRREIFPGINFREFFSRHFVGINFHELGFSKDFAGINVRKLGFTKNFAGIYFRALGFTKAFAGINIREFGLPRISLESIFANLA